MFLTRACSSVCETTDDRKKPRAAELIVLRVLHDTELASVSGEFHLVSVIVPAHRVSDVKSHEWIWRRGAAALVDVCPLRRPCKLLILTFEVKIQSTCRLIDNAEETFLHSALIIMIKDPSAGRKATTSPFIMFRSLGRRRKKNVFTCRQNPFNLSLYNVSVKKGQSTIPPGTVFPSSRRTTGRLLCSAEAGRCVPFVFLMPCCADVGAEFASPTEAATYDAKAPKRTCVSPQMFRTRRK
ncbi:hypothetical protein F2P81_024471 [Scophthalmus maximus]|uniref:Uncharacterized protein n=1 Tax=Scophthalmus maximus TaxID=52904 RepID=A0A6A4RXP5_SCOMX|nr:hypothetical protein F2P81_024471 [Scophthalmus maximus]